MASGHRPLPLRSLVALYYSKTASPDIFHRLGNEDGTDRKFYDVEVIFDAGIQLRQFKGAADYFVRWDTAQTKLIDIHAGRAPQLSESYSSILRHETQRPNSGNQVDVVIDLVNNHHATVSYNNAKTLDFPLAKQYQDFGRLVMFVSDTSKTMGWSSERVATLMSCAHVYDPKSQIHDWIDGEIEAVEDEAEVERLRLSGVDGTQCTIRAERFGIGQLLLLIYPPGEYHYTDYEVYFHEWHPFTFFGDQDFSNSRYVQMFGSERQYFPTGGNSSSWSATTGLWEAKIVHWSERAPLTAIMSLSDDLSVSRLHGSVDTGCKLFFNKDNPSSNMARKIMSKISTMMSGGFNMNLHHTIKGLALDELPPSGLYSQINNQPASSTSDIDAAWRELGYTWLNESQKLAIRNMIDWNVSFIHGPAGTAKTTTIVAAIRTILAIRPQAKIMICTAQNSLADELTARLYAEQKHADSSKRLDHKLVRAHHLDRGETFVYDSVTNPKIWREAYLYEHMYRKAGLLPDSGVDFIKRYRHIQQYGAFNSDLKGEGYAACRMRLAEMVFAEASVVVCTCTAATLDFIYENFHADYIVYDDASVARPYEILGPLAYAKSNPQLVFVGDHKQFRPFFSTTRGNQQWSTSLFEKALLKGWKMQRLAINYRTHSKLWSAVNQTFYDGEYGVQSWTSELSQVSTFAHFFDIADSVCLNTRGGSSYNVPELSFCEALIDLLLTTKYCEAGDILVLTAYQEQLRRLQFMIKKNAPNFAHTTGEVKASTVRAAQGMQRPVVIISLVKTQTLHSSMMKSSNFMTVAATRAEDCLFFVGSWASVQSLKSNETLQRLLLTYSREVPGFLVKAGRSPFVAKTGQQG